MGTLGSWLTSGKLGVSVDHEEEEQIPPIVGAITEENKQKGAITAGKNSPQSDAAQASGAPGGWLPQAVSSGVLGVPQDNDAQESGDKPNNRQTEESPKVTSVEGKCRSSLDRGMPPWAENPPSTGPSHRITGVDRIKSGITSVQVETSKSSGFDRAKEVTASGSSPHAAVASAGGPLANAANGIPGPSMVVSSLETNEAVNGGSGPDSLGVMATLDQKELSPRGAPKVAKLKRRTSLATVKVEECYDRDLGIRKTDSRSGRLSAAGVKRIGELLTALARELGEWLESGSRGDLVDDENEGELKGEYGGGGRLVTHASEETQTEDVIEGTVKEGTESESKLLRRAKPWSSTQGPGKIVDYSSPRVNTKKKKVKSASISSRVSY